MKAGWCDDGKIIRIIEPRRVAATVLATRFAEEKGSQLGDVVGYANRFDDCTDKERTKIKVREIIKQKSLIIIQFIHSSTN